MVNLINNAVKRLNKISSNSHSEEIKDLTITSIIRNDTERSFQYSLINDHLLSHKSVLRSIYNTLMKDDTASP